MLIVLVSLIYVASGGSLFHADDSEGNLRMENINSRYFNSFKQIIKPIKYYNILNTT